MEKYFMIDTDKKAVKIRCKMFFKEDIEVKRAIISCHGFCGSKESGSIRKISEYILDKYNDAVVVSFDWPCHGKDKGSKLDLGTCNLYIENFLKYIKEKIHVDEIYVQATSFGGYLILKYISEHENPFKKVMLRCPAVNMYDALKNEILEMEQVEAINNGDIVQLGIENEGLVGVTKTFLEELEENDISLRDYGKESSKILIMHGTEDELISFDFVKSFAEKNNILFIPIQGANHRYSEPGQLENCMELIGKFMEGGSIK